jgi:hypothetical protein
VNLLAQREREEPAGEAGGTVRGYSLSDYPETS